MVSLTSTSQPTVHPLLDMSQARSSQEKPHPWFYQNHLDSQGSLCLHLLLLLPYITSVTGAICWVSTPQPTSSGPTSPVLSTKQDVLWGMLDELSQVKCWHWVLAEIEFTKYQSVKCKVTFQNSLTMFREMKPLPSIKGQFSQDGISCPGYQEIKTRETLQVPRQVSRQSNYKVRRLCLRSKQITTTKPILKRQFSGRVIS